jgi:hypothetical protein
MKKNLLLLLFVMYYSFSSMAYDLKIMATDMHRYEIPGTYNSNLMFQNLGTTNIQYFQLKWSLNNTLIGTESVDILSTWSSTLQPSDAFSSYYFPLTITQSLPLLTEGEYEFKMWIESVHGTMDENQSNDTIAYKIHVVDYLPEKHVLLEEYTHVTCGPCYNGDLDLELLLFSNQNLSAVSIHNSFDDPMSFPDGTSLDTYFSIGHPNFVFDRFQFAPYTEYGSMIWSGGTSPDLSKRFNMKEGLQVTISEQTYNPVNRLLSVTLKADFYANYEDSLAWNLWVVEDSIFGYQASAPDPNNYYHNHVARAILGGLWGMNMTDPTTDGSTTYKTFTYTLPQNFDENQIRVIGFIQRNNGLNKEVVNSTDDLVIQEHYVGVTSLSEKQINLFPNPAHGIVEIDSELPIQQINVFDNTGKQLLETQENKVDLTNFKNGTYLFKILTDSGFMFIRVMKI